MTDNEFIQKNYCSTCGCNCINVNKNCETANAMKAMAKWKTEQYGRLVLDVLSSIIDTNTALFSTIVSKVEELKNEQDV